jgi:hypothetical protein
MIRTKILRTRRERNRALLEAMLLATQEGGALTEGELRGVLGTALQVPELRSERPEVLEEWLRRGSGRLLQPGRERLFSSLRARLPDPHNRLLAYGLAVKVSPAGAQRQEEGLLSRLQEELGVTALQARQLCSDLAGGASPSALAAEPAARMHARALETVLVVAGLDASLSDAEVAALQGAQMDEQGFMELVQQQLRRVAFGTLAEDPMAAVHRQLEVLALMPAPVAQRREVWLLASRFSNSMGRSLLQELVLALMQELLGLDEESEQRLKG